jgi:hypothetical protein
MAENVGQVGSLWAARETPITNRRQDAILPHNVLTCSLPRGRSSRRRRSTADLGVRHTGGLPSLDGPRRKRRVTMESS